MMRHTSIVATLVGALLLASSAAFGAASKTTVALDTWHLAPQSPTGNDPCCTAAGHTVKVPSTILGSLLEAGAYTYLMSHPSYQPSPEKPNEFDPFYGQNLKLISDAPFNTPWEYTCEVAAPAMPGSGPRAALLVLEGINYRADVYVNGQLVGERSKVVGALVEFTFDISSVLRMGNGEKNTIKIVLVPGSRSSGEWRTNNTDLAISFEDWNPHPQDLTMGLWKPARIDFVSTEAPLLVSGLSVSVDRPIARKYWNTAAATPLNVHHSFVVRSLSDVSYTTNLKLILDGPDGTSQLFLTPSLTIQKKSSIRVEIPTGFTIQHNQLWEPRVRPHPDRVFTFTVTDFTNNEVLLHKEVSYRHVRHEFTLQGSLKMVINEKYHQIQGAGWNPDMFMRIWDYDRLEQEFRLVSHMGINAIRLEGMLMHDRFYELADKYGIIIMPGWACCTGWEHWSVWPKENYDIARASAVTQARIISSHASVISFMIGSDDLPPPIVEKIYNEAFAEEKFSGHIISSASQEVSTLTGNPGVKMVGPYSWVPPNYWLTDPPATVGNFGGAWGFLSEGGPGESPMNYNSWKRTVPSSSLWNSSFEPNGVGSSLDESWSWHVGNPNGYFSNLQYYTPPLNARYGAATSAPEYCFRAQMATYESIRSYMESYRRNSQVNATGYIQWMLNNAWPSHLWHLYDYYLVGGGEYYATKVAMRDITLMMSYNDGTVWLDVRSDALLPNRETATGSVVARIFRAVDGAMVWEASAMVQLDIQRPTNIPALTIPINGGTFLSAGDSFLVQLSLRIDEEEDANPTVVDRHNLAPQGLHVSTNGSHHDIHNWYWLSVTKDVLDWSASNGFRTPCLSYANYSQLMSMPQSSSISVSLVSQGASTAILQVTNKDTNHVAIAVILRMIYVSNRTDVAAARFSDGYFVLLPSEGRRVLLEFDHPGLSSGFGTTWTYEVNWLGNIPH